MPAASKPHQTGRSARRSALVRQIARVDRRTETLRGRADQLSLLRLGVFVLGAAGTLGAGLISASLLWIVLIVALIVFIASVVIHRRAKWAADRWRFWGRVKREHLARLDLDWTHLPEPRAAAAATTGIIPLIDHPFERDLDLTGPRSIHHLMDTATSAEGSGRLRDWLLNRDPQHATILERQARVKALIRKTAFRDKLAWAAEPLSGRGRLDSALVGWLRREPKRLPVWSLPTLSLLAALNVGLALLTVLNPALITPLENPRGILFLAYALLYGLHARTIADLFDEASGLGAAFTPLQRVLGLIERLPLDDSTHALEPLLITFHGADRPSAQLAGLNRVIAASSVRGSPLLWLILNLLMPWDLLAFTWLERVKTRLSGALESWLAAWHELEALGSLANFAYLNPAATFPVITTDGPIFDMSGIGHPLIPDAEKVRNGFTLDAPGELILITGSNMAGKSSFLRAVGMGAVLAHAGGAVDAETARLQVCRVFACMRVADSVTDGISYFYAEVTRLRALLTELERPDTRPILYLIDEIFRGTNNRERLIGSRAYLRALIAKHGAGFVSTHDLELVELEKELPTLHNYHFREEIVADRMQFDYQLRRGPSPTTNALIVMRIAGLPVA